jgi:hypothetical protein
LVRGLASVGTIVYNFLEDWSWVDSLYFATVAVTTVGFGDLVPTGDGSSGSAASALVAPSAANATPNTTARAVLGADMTRHNVREVCRAVNDHSENHPCHASE